MIRFFSKLSAVLLIACQTLPAEGLSWIWSSNQPGNDEQVYFRRDFEVPENLTKAAVSSSCDNIHRLWVNGQLLGEYTEWQQVAVSDVMKHLKPGQRNVIAAEARNQGGSAAFALQLNMTLNDGRNVRINSDTTWSMAKEAPQGWETADFDSKSWAKATLIAPMGHAPWGDIIDQQVPLTPQSLAEKFKIAPGFQLESLYQIPSDQGSWVAITLAENGNFICADQYGKLYYVKPPAYGNPNESAQVKAIDAPIGGAHGLLWFQGSLYVTVNEDVGNNAGVYRLPDENKDGVFEAPILLKEIQGRGEHGPHALVPSPDGKWIYFIAGNHTDLPSMDANMPATTWQEDQLLPRQPDPNGHARERMAPGGYITRFTPDGKNWQLVSIGYRNAYDIGFNLEGELFAYDADMEWDFGTPWYRPTRINHAVAGSEMGWRNGSGKWPTYYEDSMPAVVDIGPGCPTGVVAGKGAKFPEKYQRAIYALDWTFATLYAIHLQPKGAGYTATTEEMVAGAGLPLSDAAIGADGHMYFLTGGRRTKSTMWRLSYIGKESTAAATPLPLSAEIQQRRVLDELILSPDPAALPKIWELLGATDRTMRFSARAALEKLSVTAWQDKLSSENDPWRIIHASMALARINAKDQRPNSLAALDRLDWTKLSSDQQINWLRSAGLWAIRAGAFSPIEREKILTKIDAKFPATNDDINSELCRLLSFLQAPGIVARTLALMDQAAPSPLPNWAELAKRNEGYGSALKRLLEKFPPLQNTFYAYCLREVKGPWQAGERERFFTWLGEAAKRSGGNSYVGYLNAIRSDTLGNATEDERKRFGQEGTMKATDYFANLPEIKGPGRNWTADEVEKLATDLKGRNIENGKKMAQACLCAACHVMGTEGGAAGPQLNALAGRFSVRDLAEAIIDPGKVVSDQYAFEQIEKNDGTTIVAKIVNEKDGKLIIASNPFDMQQHSEIPRADVKSIAPSKASPMPPALINRLNEDELKDLLAYLLGN